MHRYTITLDAEAREKLEMLLKVHTTEQRMAERARIILLAADGKGVSEIAEKLDCSKRRVCGWKKRYLEEGMAGLEEKQRSGRPLRISEFGGQSFRNEKYKCFGFKWTVISVLNGQFCVNSETGVHITPKRVSRLLRNGCPDYSETGVQITPKRVSILLRNGCPYYSETGVQITPKRVSRLLRNGCPDYSETGVQIFTESRNVGVAS